MVTRTILAAGAALALSLGGPAAADIVFVQGNVPGNLDTILFDANDPGDDNLLLGLSNEGWDVLLTGEEDIIATGGPSQAWVVGTADGGLTYLNISTPGATFTAAELKINVPGGGGPPQEWSITLGGVDSNGDVFSEFFSGITNDQFFNFVATNGQVISSIDFRTSNEVALGQLRMGGIAAIPEPATWAMMILGFGGVGAVLRQRRRLGLALA